MRAGVAEVFPVRPMTAMERQVGPQPVMPMTELP